MADTIQKRYYYKIYNGSTLAYITTWTADVISDPTFRSIINGGSGQLMVRLARPFDNFGEGDDVTLQNRVELWVADSDYLANNASVGTLWDTAIWDSDYWDDLIHSFQKIFTGFISAYAPVISGQDQYVDVTVLGFVVETSYRILKDNTGSTTVAYSAQDPGTIMRSVIDRYRADGGTNLNYIGSSISTVGVSATYTFNSNTLAECFDRIVAFCPVGYFWYIDANGTVFLKQAATFAEHVLTIGKDISFSQTNKRIENLVNVVYVIGGGATPLYNKYTRNGSVTAYGKYEIKINDGQVVNNATADLIAKAKLDQLQTPETRTLLRIIDNNGENANQGQNIESFKIGDTIQIKNLNYGGQSTTDWDTGIYDTSVWDSTIQFTSASILTIVSIQYTPDYIEVEASTRLPEISRSLADLERSQSILYNQGLPSIPTVRSV